MDALEPQPKGKCSKVKAVVKAWHYSDTYFTLT